MGGKSKKRTDREDFGMADILFRRTELRLRSTCTIRIFRDYPKEIEVTLMDGDKKAVSVELDQEDAAAIMMSLALAVVRVECNV